MRVSKNDLLTILRENRARHSETFQKALDAYYNEMLRLLEQKIADVRAGRKVSHVITLPTPEEHIADYDRVIGMLEMSLDEEVELDEHQYDEYVNDEWGWRRSFTANTSSYLGK
jgi:hypothetical protein